MPHITRSKNNYLNKKYKDEFIYYMLIHFEQFFGMDISKYILTYIIPEEIDYCSICCYYIRVNYMVCKSCGNFICLKCYNRFHNEKIPLCYDHLDYNKYSNMFQTLVKKRLLKIVRKKLKRKSVNLLHVISRNNNDIYSALFRFNMKKQTITLPHRKYIKKNFFVIIQNYTLIIVFIDNIDDNYYYELF